MNFNGNRTAALLALAMFASTVVGCGGYGPVSPKAYELSTALYSIANRQDASRLDTVETQIEAAVAAKELSDREAQWLGDILQECRTGDWKKAGRLSRRMMEDQVEK